MHRACLTAGGHCRARRPSSRRSSKAAEALCGVAGQQFGDHALVLEQIARRRPLDRLPRGCARPGCCDPGVHRGVAAAVDDGQLPVVGILFLCQSGFECGIGVGAACERVEHPWAERGVGDVLRRDHPDGRPRVRTARRDRGARRTDDDAECAAGGISRNERECHSSVSFAFADHRGGVDLHQPLGARECLDDQPGRDRVDALEPAAHDPVHRFAVADVGEVDGDLDDVLQRAARLVEEHRDVAHRLLGLCRDVADADRLPGVEILADLSTQVDHSAGDDRLAQIVVEVLFRIGVLGVEGPDPLGVPCVASLIGHPMSDGPAS